MIKKLRAWDLINEKYYTVESWHLEHEYVDLIDSSKNVSDPNAERLWRKESDVILEQSTGTVDVNGNDIFEGDIIHFSYNNSDYYSPVVFADGKFTGKTSIIPDVNLEVMSTGEGYHFMSPIQYYYSDMSIVGNIHENSDLLRKDEVIND